MGVSNDLPASKKVCGFLSHSATLGCSKCYHKFFDGARNADYGGNFDRAAWKLSKDQHRADVQKILKSTTAKEKAELKYGCRYSVLLDLPYFDPIRMVLINPMHNLFMGTAKHVTFHILIGRNILGKEALKKIEHRLSTTVVPPGLGRLPKSVNIGTFLTAEQWKNWTLYFSIFCLHGLLSTNELECWRHFVLACQRLCKFCVTRDDVTVADALLLQFCKRVKRIYGVEALIPNQEVR